MSYIENGIQNNSGKVEIKTVIEWMIKLSSVLLIPLMIWLISLVISLDKRVSIIEGNRFTTGDAIQMRSDISGTQDDLIDIQARMSKLEDCQVKIRLGNPQNC